MDFKDTRYTTTFRQVTGIAQGAVASGIVSVKINGTAVSCIADRALTTALGDVVYGRQLNGRIVIEGRLWTAAPTAPDDSQSPPPAPEPEFRTGTTTIAPVETRSYRPNWGWRTDNDSVYQGEYGNNGNHKGCVFYGTKPRSLKGVTVTRASIRVKRQSAGWYSDQRTTLNKITNRTKPAGAPTLTGSDTTGPRLAVGETDNDFVIPDSYAQALIDGTCGGFAIYDSDGSPYVRLAGRGAWGPAFTLKIAWRRAT